MSVIKRISQTFRSMAAFTRKVFKRSKKQNT